jgi:hypothetical protein
MIPDKKSSMKSNSDGNRISLLRIQRYLIDDLPSDERVSLEYEIRQNPELAEYLEEIKSSKSALEWPTLRSQLSELPPLNHGESFLAKLRNYIVYLLPEPTPARLSWAGAFAVLFLLLPAVFLKIQPDSGFRAKGNSHTEIILEVGGHRMTKGQKRHVNSGEILTFSYRSVKPIFTQIWYQEDGGSASLFDGSDDISLLWPASSNWAKPVQRIRLEGNWKVQRVLILVSLEKITGDEARKLITGERKPKKDSEVFTYDLLQP